MFDSDFDETSPTIYPYTVFNFNGMSNNSTLQPWNKQSGLALRREIIQMKKKTINDGQSPTSLKQRIIIKRAGTTEFFRNKFRKSDVESAKGQSTLKNVPISNLTFTAGLKYEERGKSIHGIRKVKKSAKSEQKIVNKNLYEIQLEEKAENEENLVYKIWKPSIDRPFQLKRKIQQQKRTQEILMRREIDFSKMSVTDILNQKRPCQLKKEAEKHFKSPPSYISNNTTQKPKKTMFIGLQKLRKQKELQKRKVKNFDGLSLGY